ncbi:MAG TPA: molybdenum cofactor guanylyltransferase MobA [Rhizomicrobium sp.]|nr:molybdenum cofactor guanylyltransferase MobA [Rhizomicrobium sp.]
MRPAAVILAGGRSSRMGGGDKCLLPLGDRPLIAHILDAVTPQTGDILINTNSDPAPFLKYGQPVLPDAIAGFQGPLAGILTGMLWSRKRHPRRVHLLTVASDVPFLPDDLVARLSRALQEQRADIAIASSPEGTHPTIGLWPVDLAQRLEHDLMEGSVRSVHQWISSFRVACAEFDSIALANINTPADLAACQHHRPLDRRPAWLTGPI